MTVNQSLFYEYAITPDVFDPAYVASDPRLEVILIQMLKDICENGMIADLHDGYWSETVRLRLDAITSSSLKDRIQTLFNRLKDLNRFVLHPKTENSIINSDIEWLKLAINSQVDEIISSHRVIEQLDKTAIRIINALEILDSAPWSNRRRTMTLKTNEAYYRPVLEPILRHARSLTIVDPYFSPHKDRFINFLKLCLEYLGKRGEGKILPGRIIINTGDPAKETKLRDAPTEDIKQRKDAWKRKLIELTKDIPHEFNVHFRTNGKNGGAKFHDRYILTDQCCIAIPLGTDTCSDNTSTTTTWCFLDHQDMLLKKKEIIDPNKYEFLATIKYSNGNFKDT
jgi:hypothetical protein